MGKTAVKTVKKKIRRICYEVRKFWRRFGKDFGEEAEGFTYVETVAVIAIGAVLTARKTAAKNQIEQFSCALQIYFLDCGRFPTTEQGLSALWEKPVFYPVPENWNGPYLDREPGNDPWGTDFKYLSAESSIMPSEVPENLPYVLISYGPDRKEGGEGGSDDICSWK